MDHQQPNAPSIQPHIDQPTVAENRREGSPLESKVPSEKKRKKRVRGQAPSAMSPNAGASLSGGPVGSDKATFSVGENPSKSDGNGGDIAAEAAKVETPTPSQSALPLDNGQVASESNVATTNGNGPLENTPSPTASLGKTRAARTKRERPKYPIDIAEFDAELAAWFGKNPVAGKANSLSALVDGVMPRIRGELESGREQEDILKAFDECKKGISKSLLKTALAKANKPTQSNS